MNISPIAPSTIREPKPAAAVPPPAGPPKVAPAPKPPVAAKPPEAKKPETPAEAANGNGAGKIEITDVKPTGEQNAEGNPTFTLKVNGQEYKATQSEILALAQKAKGAEAAMAKAAEIEKLAAGFLETFDNDAYSLLVQRHGKEKADQIVIGMTKKLIAEEEKDPKDRELESLRKENETYKQAEDRIKKEQEEKVRKANQLVLYKQMLTDIDTELNSTHLPKDKLTLTRVLQYLAAGKKANGTTWTVKEAVQAVEVEDMGHATYYAKRYVEGKLPSEKFREIFGEETFKKLNKESIALLKNADKSAKNVQPQAPLNGSEAPKRAPRSLSRTKGTDGMSEREYRRQHGSLGGI